MRDLLTAIHYGSWILPVLLLLPVAGAVVIWVAARPAPHEDEREYGESFIARDIAIGVLLLELVLSLGLWWAFDKDTAAWQFVVDLPWLAEWGARFTVGLDGISLMMVLLTTVLMPIAVLGGWTGVRHKLRTYYALFLLLEAGILGTFLALDLLLFYVMWEIMLIPIYFIIGIYGGERRIYASIKFFLYTLSGSLLMLLGVIVLWRYTGGTSFAFDEVMRVAPKAGPAALWLFGAFSIAFAIKVPIFPFHTWLPDAHVEAPTAGSVILAGVLLKMGTYGFLRFSIPLFPAAAVHPTVRTLVLALAVIGIIYGALVALVQTDIKKLVAYSSVSHLGFVMLGIFAFTEQSVQGAQMVTISHGISSGALFLLVGMIYERTHTRLIAAYGGIARAVPMFSAALALVAMSSIGLPGTNGFVGEFLVLIGTYSVYPYLAAAASVGVILGAAYLLWALQRIIFNPLDNRENATLSDLNRRELAVMGVIAVLIVWLGVMPEPLLSRTASASRRLVDRVHAASPVPVSAAATALAPAAVLPAPAAAGAGHPGGR
ncbi:MAG: NADH-quinone oxidoreductase subunit M [Gemmatimonadetes bacterium]|nr:NADH-quinone oxidoreductase subunit M [Gemmatimonadota bacterium]